MAVGVRFRSEQIKKGGYVLVYFFVSKLLVVQGKMSFQILKKKKKLKISNRDSFFNCTFVCFVFLFFLQEELYLKRVAELDEITNERDKFRQAFEDLRKQRLNEFMAGFNVITNKLKENYQMLTLGGDAELELVDSLDPFSEGIMFRFVKILDIAAILLLYCFFDFL